MQSALAWPTWCYLGGVSIQPTLVATAAAAFFKQIKTNNNNSQWGSLDRRKKTDDIVNDVAYRNFQEDDN